jgi:hypothetical protein
LIRAEPYLFSTGDSHFTASDSTSWIEYFDRQKIALRMIFVLKKSSPFYLPSRSMQTPNNQRIPIAKSPATEQAIESLLDQGVI